MKRDGILGVVCEDGAPVGDVSDGPGLDARDVEAAALLHGDVVDLPVELPDVRG